MQLSQGMWALSLFEWNYYLHDHLGNTRVVLDEQGDVKEYYDYHPFGKIMPGRSLVSGEQPATFKYTGKELDDENALEWYYFGARYYDAEIGRWLTPDPIFSDFSPYNYCLGNPINFVDPFGLSAEGNDFWEKAKSEFNSDWDAVWSPENGGLPGWSSWSGTARSYLENYSNEAGGHWERQHFGAAVRENLYYGDWAEWWIGYDWIWVGPYSISWGARIWQFFDSGGYSRSYDYINGQVFVNSNIPIITGTPPAVGLSGGLINAKGMTNAWNYFQHINKGRKVTPAMYQAWKGTIGHKVWQAKRAAYLYYPKAAKQLNTTKNAYNSGALDVIEAIIRGILGM